MIITCEDCGQTSSYSELILNEFRQERVEGADNEGVRNPTKNGEHQRWVHKKVLHSPQKINGSLPKPWLRRLLQA